jgi:general L-amino acid transport system substrate-binding protein
MNRSKVPADQEEVSMKKSVFLGTLTAAGLAAGLAGAATLDDVKARGELNCGVSSGLAGFSNPDANGVWTGFDVAVCRAVAAAVLGDPMKVKFVPTTGQTRFTALASGEIDMLSRNTTWTFSRDADLKFTFVGVNYYDGQGFMIRKDMGVSSAKELDGATVCIQTGTTTELNLADFFKVNGMAYEPVPIETNAEAQQQYLAGACDVYTTDASGLAATRATFADPENHILLPEIISKEPLGPLVRHGDDQWGDIVRWSLNALTAAEEYGVTSANIEELAKGTNNPEINRLLGTEGDLGAMIGLDKDWAKRAIMAGGNYGEIFAAHIGESTPIGLARGLNAQWTQGGLIYSPPFR